MPVADAVANPTVSPLATEGKAAADAADTVEQAVLPPPPLPGGSDSAFSADEFRLVEAWLGTKFTLDGACNDKGQNALCAQFASPSRSFLGMDVAGQILWCHAPHGQVEAFAEHYRTCKTRRPTDTSAVFVAPQWPELEQYFQKSGFRLLKSYPRGAQLFAHSGSNVTTLAAPWPVQLWYDPPEPDAKLSAVAPKVSYTMTFRGHAGHTPVSTLVDSGACTVGTADGYISASKASSMGLNATESPTPAVRLADGTRKALGGQVQTRLSMGSYHGMVRLLVLPDIAAGADIILGTDWLERHGALMDWESHTLTLHRVTGHACGFSLL